MQHLLNFILRPDWCVNEDGDCTLRLWGWFGITHYKEADGAIFGDARKFQRVKKRGIACFTE